MIAIVRRGTYAAVALALLAAPAASLGGDTQSDTAARVQSASAAADTATASRASAVSRTIAKLRRELKSSQHELERIRQHTSTRSHSKPGTVAHIDGISSDIAYAGDADTSAYEVGDKIAIIHEFTDGPTVLGGIGTVTNLEDRQLDVNLDTVISVVDVGDALYDIDSPWSYASLGLYKIHK